MYPDLTPITPLTPIWVTMLWRVPASGRVICVMPTISANVGMAMPTAAIRRTSEADETVWGS